jgi:transposase
MTTDKINADSTIKQVKDLLANEKNLSPALKASLETLLHLVTIWHNRLGLNSKKQQ